MSKVFINTEFGSRQIYCECNDPYAQKGYWVGFGSGITFHSQETSEHFCEKCRMFPYFYKDRKSFLQSLRKP